MTKYFTSTAASGAGTLREAISTANPWDEIKPDPDLFPPGTRIEIALTGSLAPAVPLILDAAGTVLILRQNIPLNAKASDGCSWLMVNGVTFVGRAICTGAADNPIDASFSGCTFAGGASYLFQSASGNALLNFEDCLFTGGLTRAVYLSGDEIDATFTRCTITGNKGAGLYGNAASGAELLDCINVDETEAAEFIDAPADLSEYSAENPPNWERWNLRPVAGSKYATGATTAVGKYDRDGLPRKEGGALGAYEATTAAAYWVGYDAEGEPVAAPRWNAVEGWATTPTATAGDLEEPPTVVRILNNVVEFVDAPQLERLEVANSTITTADEPGGVIAVVKLGKNCKMTAPRDVIANLTISPGATYSGRLDGVDITIKSGGMLWIRGECVTTRAAGITLDDGATLFIGNGAALSTARAEIGAATITSPGRGYFAPPNGTDASLATFENVIITPQAPDVSGFKVHNVGGTAQFEISGTTDPVFLERVRTGTFSTISTEATSATTAELFPGVNLFRIFNGVSRFFWTSITVAREVWTVEAWGDNSAGGGAIGADGEAWKVGIWGMPPQIEHKTTGAK